MSSTGTPAARERLKAIRERTVNARSQRNRMRDQLQAAEAANDTDACAVSTLALDQASQELEIAESLEAQLLSHLAGVNGHDSGLTVFDDPKMVEQLERLGNSSMPVGRMDLGPVVGADRLASMIESGTWHQPRTASTGGSGGIPNIPDVLRGGSDYGIVPQLRRPLRLLDLIPSAVMDGRSIGYVREQGSVDTAFEVAEGAIKPQAELHLTEDEAVAVTIAHWLKLRRQQLSDVPALATLVSTRLVAGVLRRVEDEILAGTGVGERMVGILNTTGVGDIPFDVNVASLADLALDGMTLVTLSDTEPTGVVLHPSDWADMLKTMTQGSGARLDSGGAFGTSPTSMWGLPVVVSSVMPQGQALVGDFSNGVTLFIREGVHVRTSDADSDDFVRNQLTVLGEGRFALAVWLPTAFALVHLS